MIKISIVIPVYNVEKYLRDCIESVINQTEKDIEIICIDDGSTDNSLKILDEIAAEEERVKIFCNDKNRGLSYTRNRGLGIAKGKYIYFLDSDDMIVSGAMEELYDFAVTQQADVILFETALKFETELLKEKFYNYQHQWNGSYTQINSGRNSFIEFMKNKDWVSSVPRQFWRREFLIESSLKFHEGILHEDQVFTFQALLEAERVGVLKKEYFIRRFRENSIMTKKHTWDNVRGLFICYYYALFYTNTISNIDKELEEALQQYFLLLLNNIKKEYRFLEDKITLESGLFENQAQYELFKVIICNFTEEKKKWNPKLIEEARLYKNIYIYGAGKIGKEILEIFDRNEIGIKGYIVTKKDVNPQYIMGHSVYAVDELECDNGETLFVVAIMPKYQNDIIIRLRQRGYTHYIKAL
jgi:glycosyltransferase involved in cell wall biosynthesis